MSCIEIHTLPCPVFAHTFAADNYQNVVSETPNSLEITHLVEGEFLLAQDGQNYRAVAGDYICNKSQSPLTVLSKGTHCHHTVRFSFQYNNLTLPLVIHPSTTGTRCKTLLDEIIRLHTLDSKQKLSCTGLFLQLLDELERIQNRSIGTVRYSPYISRAKNYIFEHIHEPIRQIDIAKHLGITPEYLCGVFKQCEGISLIPYINIVKLESMTILMKREGISLRQAASLYGYSDPNYVSRMYKRLFGCNITEHLRHND